jgi:hypothetical protein
MAITGQVGTATEPAQRIPSLGGFMVLGVVRNLCLISRIRKHSRVGWMT